MICDDIIHMRHIKPAQNMARFYEISLQPTLFGEVSLLRRWGRIGTKGQSLRQTYSSLETAALAATKLDQHKRKRGYL